MLDELRSFFASLIHRKQSARTATTPLHDANNYEQGRISYKQSDSQEMPESPNSDPYGTLSEVAAPEPVQQVPEEELERHSLEQRLSNTQHEIGKNEERLSEIAAPRPTRRRTDEEKERHAFLEQRLSHLSRH